MRIQDLIARGLRSAQPAATAVSAGALYYVTDESKIERSNGATWDAYSAAGAGAGVVVQVVRTPTPGAVATGTTVIPLDDTIPQITEGNEYLTLAITPTSATNKLLIDVVVHLAHSVINTWLTAALFQDATANALASAVQTNPSTDGNTQLTLTHYMTAGTTSATTFRVRGGGNGAGTTTFNGRLGARLCGGTLASSITITEVTP